MAPVYVLDACVLYPVVIRDLLLTLATLDAFEPRWTEAILDEMTRNVIADHPTIDPAHFEAGSVDSWRPLIEGSPSVVEALVLCVISTASRLGQSVTVEVF